MLHVNSDREQELSILEQPTLSKLTIPSTWTLHEPEKKGKSSPIGSEATIAKETTELLRRR